MNRMKNVAVAALIAGSTAVLLAMSGRIASGEDRAGAAMSNPSTTHEFVGTKKCRMCHSKQYASWLKSPHAPSGTPGAWDILQRGASPEKKRRAGLAVDADYTGDERCLGYHAVGFGRPGGYAVPDPEHGRSQRAAAVRRGVGCEACHGPGGGFVQIMRDIRNEQRPYRPEELHSAGLLPVTQVVCASCHSDNAPCATSPSVRSAGSSSAKPFQPDLADRRSFHKAFPLKFRKTTRVKLVNEKSGENHEPRRQIGALPTTVHEFRLLRMAKAVVLRGCRPGVPNAACTIRHGEWDGFVQHADPPDPQHQLLSLPP